MGTVYLAERADQQYQASVAVKFARGGFAAPELERRFRAERQFLADLAHPNIARLLDGGTTPDGTPYLVMELVEGEPIDVWCDQREVGLDGRLALFQKVCAAVQHAHQALLVHRDLKPSNILVSADGTPKLVDFGIAKLLAADGDADATATMRLMTPAYSAPEQVRGGRITVATDVYALGGVLYRLLAGRVPFDVTGSSPAEVERLVCDTEPVRPSAAASGRAAAWRRRLGGDLDTIVVTALHKDPARRYPSVDRLAEDLRRYADGQPVLARRDSPWYRAGKYIRRHRVGVATAAAIVLLTAAYTLRLASERDRARVESTKAAQVTAFLTELFAVSSPEVSQGREITARELLDSGRTRIATELVDQPEVRATLLQTMGEAYWKLGLYDTATTVIQEALGLRDSLFGHRHPDVARSLNILGALLYERGGRDSALVLLEDALAIRRSLGTRDTATALVLNDLGWLMTERGELARAESLNREALALRRALRGSEHPDVAESLNNLGAVLFSAGRYEEAESLYAEAYEMRRRLLGERHPLGGYSQNNLANAAEYAGRLEVAERSLRKSLELGRVSMGADHPEQATSLVNLGRVLGRQGRYAEGERVLREAIALDRRGRGPNHPYVAYDLRMLGNLLRAAGDARGAREPLEQAIAIYRRSDPSPGGGIGQGLTELGTTLVELSEFRAAERRLREALTLLATAYPAEHPAAVDARIALGAALAGQRRFAESEQLLLDAERVSGAHADWGGARLVSARGRLAELYEAWDRPAEARRYRGAER
jgi:serine/threonine-protein kinase